MGVTPATPRRRRGKPCWHEIVANLRSESHYIAFHPRFGPAIPPVLSRMRIARKLNGRGNETISANPRVVVRSDTDYTLSLARMTHIHNQ